MRPPADLGFASVVQTNYLAFERDVGAVGVVVQDVRADTLFLEQLPPS